jgi:hypothetical protein
MDFSNTTTKIGAIWWQKGPQDWKSLLTENKYAKLPGEVLSLELVLAPSVGESPGPRSSGEYCKQECLALKNWQWKRNFKKKIT